MSKSTFWSITIITAISIAAIFANIRESQKISIIAATALLMMIFSLILHEKQEEQTLQHAFKCLNIITRDNIVVDIEGIINYTSFEVAEEDRPKEESEDLAPQMMQNMTEGYLYRQIKQMTFDELSLNQQALQDKLVLILNEKVNEWGLRVDRLFFQSIKFSDLMKKAMLKVTIDNFNQKQTSIAEADMIKTISSAIPKGEGNTLHYLLAKKYITSLAELASQQNNNMILMPFETSKILDQVETTLKLKKNLGDNKE